jgi:regulator of Ty1 transposition protein 103
MSAFDHRAADDKFKKLEDTQLSIETLTQWCLFHRRHTRAVTDVWASQYGLTTLPAVPDQSSDSEEYDPSAPEVSPPTKTELTHARAIALVHLCNDILHKSKSKGITAYLDDFALQLKSVYALIFSSDVEGKFGWTSGQVAEVRRKMERVVGVWEERKIYSPDTIKGLRVLMRSSVMPTVPVATVKDDNTDVLIKLLMKRQELQPHGPEWIKLHEQLIPLMEARLSEFQVIVNTARNSQKRPRNDEE